MTVTAYMLPFPAQAVPLAPLASGAVMTQKQNKSLAPGVPLNFWLTCSEVTLDSFHLAKAAIVNLGSELHDILDKMIEEGIEAGLARWFKARGRDEITHDVDNPPDILAEAKAEIRRKGRSQEEIRPIRPMPPGMADVDRRDNSLRASTPPLTARTYVLRYATRNIAEGKCACCPHPLASNSVRLCETHLAAQGARYKPKARERVHRSSEAEKTLYSRVAAQLGITAEHVRSVALGQRRSKAILAALKGESERLL